MKIDTSYVQHAEAAEEARDAVHPDENADIGGAVQDNGHAVEGAIDVHGQEAHDYADAAGAEYVEYDDEHDAVLREAIEHLEEAEVRETEAIAREEAALREAEAQRALVEKLKADLAREKAALATAEAERAAAAERAEAQHQELAELQASKLQAGPQVANDGAAEADALARVEAAQQVADVQRSLAEGLRVDLAREQEARAVAEAARADFEKRAAAKNQELVALKETSARLERDSVAAAAQAALAASLQQEVSSAQKAQAEIEAARDAAEDRAAKAEAKLAAAEAAVETQEARALSLEGDLTRERAEHAAASTQAQEAAQKATEKAAEEAAQEAASAAKAATEAAETELAGLRETLAQKTDELAKTQQQMAQAQARIAELTAAAEKVAAAEQAVEAQRTLVSDQVAAMDQLRTALKTAEAKAETLRGEVDTSRQELDKLRDAAEAVAATEVRLAEVQSEADGQRQRATALEDELLQARTALADVKAQREGAAKRAADAQKELAELRAAGDAASASVPVEQAPADQVESAPDDQPVAEAETETVQTTPESDSEALVQDELPVEPPAVELSAEEPAQTSADVASSDEAEAHPDSQPEAAQAAASDAPCEEPKAPAAKAADGPAERPAANPPKPRVAARKVAASETAVDRVSGVVANPSSSGNLIQSRIAKATAVKEKAKDDRRAKRVAARKLASLWNDGMSTALSCTMLDRSSTGAKLEVLEDRYNDRMNAISVGDRFTLTVSYAQERTSIACEVMWVAERRCGVRFCGQIVTQINKPAKRAMPKKAPEKATATKAIVSLFGGR